MKKTSAAFRTVVIITAAIAVGSLAIAAIIGATTGLRGLRAEAGYGGVRVDEQKSLPADKVKIISVKTVSPDVRIVGSPDSSVHARLYGTVSARQPESVPHLTADLSADGITIQAGRKPDIVLWFYSERLVLEVAIPAAYMGSLVVETTSGDVQLEDHGYGALSVSTTSGDLKTGRIRAEAVEIHTTSGEIRAEGLQSARAVISSTSGDCRLDSLTGELSATTTSGEFSVRYAEPPKGVNVRSTSGDVTLAFPAASAFNLEARSTSGDITCDFPVTMTVPRGGGDIHELVGNVGSSSLSVKVKTVSGEVKITR
jgi:lia operon protein LiaG